MRPVRTLAASLAFALATLPGSAAAQVETNNEGTVGAWRITAHARNNRLERCTADLTSNAGMLRIAWFAESREYWLSFPSPNGGQWGPGPVEIAFDRGFSTTMRTNRSNRPGVQMPLDMVEHLMRANENIVVAVDGEALLWPLNRQNMTQVLVAVENCVHRYTR